MTLLNMKLDFLKIIYDIALISGYNFSLTAFAIELLSLKRVGKGKGDLNIHELDL